MAIGTMEELLSGATGSGAKVSRSQVTVMLDKDEKALVDAECERRSISIAAFMRACIGTGLKLAAAAPLIKKA